MGEEVLQGEIIHNIADASLEIILRFDDDGKIFYGNALAQKELGYGKNWEMLGLEKVFPAELQLENNSFPLEAARKGLLF